jgi:hypothetical protein
MRFSFSFCCLSLLVLLTLSCNKPSPEPDAVLLPAELKDYTLFQPGTYWIYLDSATQQLDSVWVVSTEMTESRLGGGHGGPDLAFKFENFRMRTRSSRGGPDRVYTAERYCGLPFREDADTKGHCWAVMYSDVDPNSLTETGGARVFPYRIARDQPSYFEAPAGAYWHSQPLRMGDRVYADVLEVKQYRNYYAWAPKLGLVQQRSHSNSVPYTRTLRRAHIVQ